ncbi:MAG: DUF948 domain-containing protein [Candidatus Sericytochromatia bacterium]|nr:DUF948 domain-containing protein [Candidatus Sericytochromatia bacterium]
MLVSVGDLIWGAIGLATLALIVTLVAVALELRGVLRVVAEFTRQVERDLSPMMQDLQHIMHRLDSVSAVVGEKVEQTSHLVDRVEESLAVGRVHARDAWADTRQWLGSLRVGWSAGLQVFRDSGNGHVGNGDGYSRSAFPYNTVASQLDGITVYTPKPEAAPAD